MNIAQRESLLQTAIMIEGAAKVIESKLFNDNDGQMAEIIDLTIENLGYQINDLKELSTELKQAKQ